jgi:cytochrome P450
MPAPTRVTGRLDDMTGLTPLATTTMDVDPMAVFRRLHEEWGEVAPVELEPGFNAWLVMGHTELCQVLRQERLFAKNPAHWTANTEGRFSQDSPFAIIMYPQPGAMYVDGNEHRRLRAPIDDAVNSLRLRQVSRQVTEVCAALISDVSMKGQADLLAEYALMIPTMAIGRMYGLGLRESREIHRMQMDMVALGEDSVTSWQRFMEVMSDLVHARQVEPTGDMASVLVRHPNLKDDEERIQSLFLLFACGSQNTMAWIASALQLMLADDRFSRRLRGGRLGIDDALDEVLWRETPIASMPGRYAMGDTVLGGQAIGRGDALLLGFGPANADPQIHSDDRWSELGNRSHLAWGAGPHTCPAEVPTRVIVRTAVETALHRLPDVRLAVPPGEISRFPSPILRCPAALPVTFTPFDGTALGG